MKFRSPPGQFHHEPPLLATAVNSHLRTELVKKETGEKSADDCSDLINMLDEEAHP